MAGISQPPADTSISFFEGTDRLDELADLYGELHAHQVGVAPHLGHLTPRTAEESWRRRRRHYEQWLAVPGAFVALAGPADAPVGYALVTLAAAYQGWSSGPRVGEIKDLVVGAPARGGGVGTSLLDAVKARLAQLGVTEYRVSVIAANQDAVAFYEHRGLALVSRVFLGRVGPDG